MAWAVSIAVFVVFAAVSMVSAQTGVVVFNSFGPGDSYVVDAGNLVSGPTSPYGSYTIGLRFTPAGTTQLSRVDVAIALYSGTNAATFQLVAADGTDGMPGTLLESWQLIDQMGPLHVQNPIITVASVSHPTLQDGVSYWLVARADTDTVAAWNYNPEGVTDIIYLEHNGEASILYVIGISAYRIMGTVPAQEPRYTLVDLGSFLPTSIDDKGVMTGFVTGYWEQAARGTVGNIEILTPEGGFGRANGMAKHGLTVGQFQDGLGTNPFAMAWDEAGTSITLSVLPGGWSSGAYGVNDAGVIVGYSENDAVVPMPVWWDEDLVMHLLPDYNIGGGGWAFGVNAHGVIVGQVGSPDGYSHAVRWDTPEAFTDLGETGFSSTARGINRDGVVVGQAYMPSGPVPMMWTKENVAVPLAGLPGLENCGASKINSHGVIIGACAVTDQVGGHAVLWETPEVGLDLNSLVTLPEGFVLEGPTWINDKGVIVGYATLNYANHGFMLVPISKSAAKRQE